MHDRRIQQHFNDYTEQYTEHQAEITRHVFRMQAEFLREHAGLGHTAGLLGDMGAGSGMWADAMLAAFPGVRVVCMDLSPSMLRHGGAAAGKLPVVANAVAPPFRPGLAFDLINLSTFLHHLIDPRGRGRSVARISGFLAGLRGGLLGAGGQVLIREVFHESVLRDDLASHAFFAVSTVRLPAGVSRLVQRAGVHSQGAGVCFLTRREWRAVAAASGYRLVAARELPWDDFVGRRFGLRASGELWLLLAPAD